MDRHIRQRLATHVELEEMSGSKGQKKHLHCACARPVPGSQETGEVCLCLRCLRIAANTSQVKPTAGLRSRAGPLGCALRTHTREMS